jgi:hypothetical protein
MEDSKAPIFYALFSILNSLSSFSFVLFVSFVVDFSRRRS